jgi:hypothetical protein
MVISSLRLSATVAGVRGAGFFETTLLIRKGSSLSYFQETGRSDERFDFTGVRTADGFDLARQRASWSVDFREVRQKPPKTLDPLGCPNPCGFAIGDWWAGFR